MTQNDARDTLAKWGVFVKKITHTNRLYAIFFDKPVSFILFKPLLYVVIIDIFEGFFAILCNRSHKF